MFPIKRSLRPRISVVAAARPNFMKVGPVIRALRGQAEVELVHTGQHYDDQMYRTFFRELELPEPDLDLGVGSGSHAEQTAGVMTAYERHLLETRPDAVIVVGDVNSTVACAIAAVKMQIPVAHVEAGLRSRDWGMPEEVNRLLTDRVSRWLFTPSSDGDENLLAEGVPPDWIHLVGNVMIDTLLRHVDAARYRAESVRDRLGLSERFGIVTLHRPSNVDEANSLQGLVDAIASIDPAMDLIFPTHPRTRARLSEFGVTLPRSFRPADPLGYLDFVGLMATSQLIMTDSGGVQEETSVLGVPCLTLRRNTERPITCELGTNVLVGTHPQDIVAAGQTALSTDHSPSEIPLWDGKAGDRIARVLMSDMQGGSQ